LIEIGFADELCRKCANELYYCEWMEYSSKKKKKPRKRLIVVASFLMFVIQREGKSKLKVRGATMIERLIDDGASSILKGSMVGWLDGWMVGCRCYKPSTSSIYARSHATSPMSYVERCSPSRSRDISINIDGSLTLTLTRTRTRITPLIPRDTILFIQVELAFERQGKQTDFELHTTRIPEFLLSVRSVVATFTRGFPDSKLPQVNVPDSLYVALRLYPITHARTHASKQCS